MNRWENLADFLQNNFFQPVQTTQFMSHTLLFVDDEPQIVQSLSLLFDDYTTLTANSGMEALEIFKKGNPIDVIVSDQRMPGMLGIELLKEVKRISPTTVRILLTGYSDLEAIIESVNTGEIFRYVNKPWAGAKLKDTVSLACKYADRLKSTPMPAPKATSTSSNSAGLLSTLGVNVPTPTAGAKTEILFVDPKPANLAAYKELLSTNYTVHTAATAADAFEVLKRAPVSVLVSEVNLGDTSGIEFLAVVSNERPDIVSILVSDSRDAGIAIRLINEVQVFRYLIKPFQRELLKSAIELAVSKHQVLVDAPVLNSKAYSGVTPAGTLSQGDSKSLEEALSKVRDLIKSKATY
ncbi:MAG: hypothetical protein HY22_13785 [[Candidatus Thermochlorobacteriaceae] bacterium GBChlB]|nr:MAG: hypothetical protein HY22_13785 [[Candidatus Thermochlorobacteriaceae] bacterium GBChlB]